MAPASHQAARKCCREVERSNVVFWGVSSLAVTVPEKHELVEATLGTGDWIEAIVALLPVSRECLAEELLLFDWQPEA